MAECASRVRLEPYFVLVVLEVQCAAVTVTSGRWYGALNLAFHGTGSVVVGNAMSATSSPSIQWLRAASLSTHPLYCDLVGTIAPSTNVLALETLQVP